MAYRFFLALLGTDKKRGLDGCKTKWGNATANGLFGWVLCFVAVWFKRSYGSGRVWLTVGLKSLLCCWFVFSVGPYVLIIVRTL